MIPDELMEIEAQYMPNLPDTHVSLLKQKADNNIINTLEGFILKKLRHIIISRGKQPVRETDHRGRRSTQY